MMGMRMTSWIRGLGAVALVLVTTASAWPGQRAHAAATMEVSANGHATATLTPGLRIGVTVRGLPVPRRPYCLGLASAIDRYSLPVSLGRIARDEQGTGRITATVPPRLFPAEPAGPYLLFVGSCTTIAPDRPFVARITIRIVPALN